MVGVGQVLAQVPEDERALSESILRAARAEVWEVVQSLTAELRARRLARVAPDVPSLEAERAKRDGKR
jgi:voltage-gated potassium channel Kch